MSGHSKWATIKHKKAATDAKRGRVFTRVIREITIAARIGGGDPNSNPRLRTAILAGKNENMPNENIERAILRGTGQLEGEQFEEATFEGYGPGGVGMLIQVVTTNRNRIVGEFRHLMSKNGGNMAEAGAVGWMFHRKGELTVPKEAASEDKMMDIVLEAGADDLKDDGSAWYVVTTGGVAVTGVALVGLATRMTAFALKTRKRPCSRSYARQPTTRSPSFKSESTVTSI